VKRHHGSFDNTLVNSLNTNKFLKLLTGTCRSRTVKRETQLRFHGNSGYLKASQLNVIHTAPLLLIVCITFILVIQAYVHGIILQIFLAYFLA